MQEGMMKLFLELCGRLTQVAPGYIGEYCPLCRSGLERFIIKAGGRWQCPECGRGGELWDLLCLLHTPEVASRVLRKYGIEGSCGALRGEVERVSRMLRSKHQATRSEVLQLGLKAWEVDRIREELGDSIKVEAGGGQRGTKGEVWKWSGNSIKGFDKLIEEIEKEQEEESEKAKG